MPCTRTSAWGPAPDERLNLITESGLARSFLAKAGRVVHFRATSNSYSKPFEDVRGFEITVDSVKLRRNLASCVKIQNVLSIILFKFHHIL